MLKTPRVALRVPPWFAPAGIAGAAILEAPSRHAAIQTAADYSSANRTSAGVGDTNSLDAVKSGSNWVSRVAGRGAGPQLLGNAAHDAWVGYALDLVSRVPTKNKARNRSGASVVDDTKPGDNGLDDNDF